MQVYYDPQLYQAPPVSVVTIGTYDGVHLGHRVILDRVKALSQVYGGECTVLSFHPHPRLVVPGSQPVALLTSVEEKIARMRAAGMQRLLLYPFSERFSEMNSEAYIQTVLSEVLRPTAVVVGYDHRFGHDRSGGLDELRRGGDKYGFAVEEIPAQLIDDAKVSSTRIRQALLEGDVAEAERLLGYPYQFTGMVVRGRQLGRQIGYPTANLVPTDSNKLVPALGIYAVVCQLVSGQTVPGMLSIGTNPTVSDGRIRTIEVYLIGYEGDLYGQPLTLEFRKFLRAEAKFDSISALQAQMAEDEKAALAALAFTS